MDISTIYSTAYNRVCWRITSYQVLALGFGGFILLGALLLMTPMALATDAELSFIDALFTATSAVCVTGLVTVDTGTFFSFFGQTIIILLIQMGGLGVMTVATLLAVATGKRINLRERLLLQEATNQFDLSGVVRLTIYIIKTTLLIEFLGGTMLAIRWYQDLGGQGIYFGYWHAISAFCNAGFDLFGDYKSLMQYANDPTINCIIPLLIILGGIGFPVIADVWNVKTPNKWTLHSKLVILTTLVLIIIGTLGIMVSETGNGATFSEMGFGDKLMASFFQSVTARTAGYNTIDIGSLREGTLFFIIILMFIGASPSSMGGGVKTTTITIIVLSLISSITGKKDTHAFYKQIPQQIVYKAFTLVLVSASLIIAVTLSLTFTEHASFLKILFEVTSAFGTVGLSTGITPTLSGYGKLLLTLTMFAGRVGTLTLLLAIALRPQRGVIQYPAGKILIG